MTDEPTTAPSRRGGLILKIAIILFVAITAAWFLYRHIVIADTFPGM